MIKKLVGLQQQATPFFASVQMMAEDVRPELDRLWETAKNQFNGQTVKQDGFRPRPVSQSDAEASNLTKLYFDFWLANLIEGLLSKTGRRVAYSTEVNVTKQGNMFIVTAIVFPQPEITWQPTKEAVLAQAALIFLSDKPVEDHHVDEDIAHRRLQHRFSKNRISLITDHPDPIKEGDTVYAEITNEFAKSQNTPPEQHIVKLGPECPAYLLEALVGAKTGDTVLAGKNVDPAGNQKVTFIVFIKGLVEAPEVTDRELLQVQDHATMDILRMNVKREIERNLSTNFDDLFSKFLRTKATCSPISGAMVFDRAEGVVNHLIQNKTQVELRRAGITDFSSAVQTMLPRMNDEIYRECVCAELANELGLVVNQEDLDDFATKNGHPISPEILYIAEMDILLHKVYGYYRSKGQDRGDIKRVEIATSMSGLPQPPTESQTQRNNLIHLK